MPDATYHHRALTVAPAREVWTHLQDPATWATVAGVDSTSDHTYQDSALTGFRFTTSIGGVSYRGSARVTEPRHGDEMTLAIESNELHGSITVALASEGSGTALDVTLTMRPAGIVGTMIFPLASAAVAGGFTESVERLAERMA